MSSADVVQMRPARWPWVILVCFFAGAAVGFVFLVVNGESVAEQVSFIVAFGMFAIVGALIVSRDRRNAIGIILLSAAIVLPVGFMCGELTTWFARRGDGGVLVGLFALVSNSAWLLGIGPALF